MRCRSEGEGLRPQGGRRGLARLVPAHRRGQARAQTGFLSHSWDPLPSTGRAPFLELMPLSTLDGLGGPRLWGLS